MCPARLALAIRAVGKHGAAGVAPGEGLPPATLCPNQSVSCCILRVRTVWQKDLCLEQPSLDAPR